MIYEDDYRLECIPSYLHAKITTLLDYNESWKKLERIDKLYQIIKPPKILPPQKTPSEYLLDKLIEKLCTMGILRDILRHSELYDALATFYTENLEIKKQPTDAIKGSELILKRKAQFKLEFSVWGIPQPEYQWYKDEEKIPDQTSSTLFYESYTPNMEGEYYCIATQTTEDLITNEIKVKDSLQSDFVDVLTQQERCIITKMPPIEISRKVGDPDILLEVIADGFPVPRYQWTHNNKVLTNMKHKIKIPTNIEMTGVYRCRISNGINELDIKTTVKIIDPNFKFPVCLETVSEKVALVIGNENYENQEKLQTPVNDAKALKTKLESIGFLVLNANNLNRNGMLYAIEYFRQMCCKGCIAVFYYAGHGFELGEKYLMPVNVPDCKNYRIENSICEFDIFKPILSQEPKLLLTLLDMCLTFPNVEENPGIFVETRKENKFKCKRNLIRGYSTTTGYSSIEMQKEIKHSIYNVLLQDNITKKVPVLQMLRAVHSEFEDLAKASGKMRIAEQMPTITEHVSKDYYLDVEKKGNLASREVLDGLQRPSAKRKPNIQGH